MTISKTTRDTNIVTIERQWEVVCALSNDDISNNLDGPLTRFIEVEYRENKRQRQSYYFTLIGNYT